MEVKEFVTKYLTKQTKWKLSKIDQALSGTTSDGIIFSYIIGTKTRPAVEIKDTIVGHVKGTKPNILTKLCSSSNERVSSYSSNNVTISSNFSDTSSLVAFLWITFLNSAIHCLKPSLSGLI